MKHRQKVGNFSFYFVQYSVNEVDNSLRCVSTAYLFLISEEDNLILRCVSTAYLFLVSEEDKQLCCVPMHR